MERHEHKFVVIQLKAGAKVEFQEVVDAFVI